jgi:Haem-binding domain
VVLPTKEKSVKKLLQTVLLGGTGLVGLGSVFVHPFGAFKARTSNTALFAGASVDPSVVRIVERSCQSCHSERTDWPWYSYVAPMSWLIENDVRTGRSHMNLSHWDEYTLDKQQEILTELSAVVRSRQMPLPRYVRLDPAAKLSDSEIDQIYQWARGERRRLKSIAHGLPKTQD